MVAESLSAMPPLFLARLSLFTAFSHVASNLDILMLEMLALRSRKSSPVSVSRQGFACKSLQSISTFKLNLFELIDNNVDMTLE
jgi:hypothetical protein